MTCTKQSYVGQITTICREKRHISSSTQQVFSRQRQQIFFQHLSTFVSVKPLSWLKNFILPQLTRLFPLFVIRILAFFLFLLFLIKQFFSIPVRLSTHVLNLNGNVCNDMQISSAIHCRWTLWKWCLTAEACLKLEAEWKDLKIFMSSLPPATFRNLKTGKL